MELKLRILLAQKRAEAVRVQAQAAKAGFKKARKIFKKAKKLAREARKKLKALKKALIKAVRAAQKPPIAARRKTPRVGSPKPVIAEPAVPPAVKKRVGKVGAKKHPAARTTRRAAPKRLPIPGATSSGLAIVAPESGIGATPAATPPGEMPGMPPAILFPDPDSEPKPPAA